MGAVSATVCACHGVVLYSTCLACIQQQHTYAACILPGTQTFLRRLQQQQHSRAYVAKCMPTRIYATKTPSRRVDGEQRYI